MAIRRLQAGLIGSLVLVASCTLAYGSDPCANTSPGTEKYEACSGVEAGRNADGAFSPEYRSKCGKGSGNPLVKTWCEGYVFGRAFVMNSVAALDSGTKIKSVIYDTLRKTIVPPQARPLTADEEAQLERRVSDLCDKILDEIQSMQDKLVFPDGGPEPD